MDLRNCDSKTEIFHSLQHRCIIDTKKIDTLCGYNQISLPDNALTKAIYPKLEIENVE